MVTRVPAERHVLEWARKVSGLAVEEAAELLGCKPDAVREVEGGTKLPSVTMFRNMARIYGFPEATLLAGEPPDLPNFPQDHRTFEGVPAHLGYRTILAIRRVQMRQESLKELSEQNGVAEAPTLRRYNRATNAEDVAAAERRAFGLDVVHQLQLSTDKLWMTYRMRIEAMGISVFVEDFPTDDCRGVSLFVDQFPAIILSGEEYRQEWKLFSLLHEYAHILIREPGISDQRAATRSPVERFCNQFAAAFLMPKAAIEATLPVNGAPIEYDIGELHEASHRIGVSISALSLRVEDLGFAPAGFYSRVRAILKPPVPRKRSTGGPIPREYVVLNQYGHAFTGNVLRYVESGTLTTLDASRLLQTNPSYLEKIGDTIADRRRDYLNVGSKG